jgi:hypothetical protein
MARIARADTRIFGKAAGKARGWVVTFIKIRQIGWTEKKRSSHHYVWLQLDDEV